MTAADMLHQTSPLNITQSRNSAKQYLLMHVTQKFFETQSNQRETLKNLHKIKAVDPTL